MLLHFDLGHLSSFGAEEEHSDYYGGKPTQHPYAVHESHVSLNNYRYVIKLCYPQLKKLLKLVLETNNITTKNRDFFVV